ncbi:hypothetical protein PsorP6_001063 [Peronosclerospora sorghi]|uniref:Uncharacterized protein n=1 Tax=Peronosclerospora sorghi TaxID=230839 RepID=A0ACC0WSK6_9STRA|nr:hypothetical protein PsorP6_001063 [Peronosclerospora sorghi]
MSIKNCLIDLNSAQETFVNNTELVLNEPFQLQSGDLIEFGASSKKFTFQNMLTDGKEGIDKKAPKQSRAVRKSPVLQEMMREMQSLCNKPNQNQYDKKKMTTDDVKKAEERKTRQAEIAAMTAQMIATSAQIPKSVAGQEAKRSDEGVDTGSTAGFENSDEDDDGAQDDVSLRCGLPKSHQVALKCHVKSLACISVDAPGARVATGSTDYGVKLWDFAGMARHVRPFLEIEVEEGYPLVAVSYSPSGNRLLAVTASSLPKVLTREGVEKMQFAKVDMYVVDMANTNGHTHTATGGQWHPKAREQMITSSLDGTVRLWKTMLIPFRNIDI